MLVVEDDPAVLRSCARVLSPHGQLQLVTSVAEALEVLDDGLPLDAVWSDRHLPDRDGGITVLRAAAERHPNAVLMLVTADPISASNQLLPAGVRVFAKEDIAAAADWLIEALQRSRDAK